MRIAVRIINSIRTGPLQHKLLRTRSEKVSGRYGDPILHTNVRWLSKSKVVFKFKKLLPEIKHFLQRRGKIYEELNDAQWLADFFFERYYNKA